MANSYLGDTASSGSHMSFLENEGKKKKGGQERKKEPSCFPLRTFTRYC